MDSSHISILLSFCVLVLCIFSQSIPTTSAFDIPPQLKAAAKKLHEHCQKKTGALEDLIHQGRDGNFSDDPALKCYIHCIFSTVGLIDESNIVHLENLMELLPPEVEGIIRNLVDKCGTQAGVDGCDTAYQTLKCYFDTDKVSLMAGFNFMFD